MKLFVMRHEKRELSDPSFETPLTTEGMENAKKLASFAQSNMDKITHIYTSPFLRCLQTIEPLIKSTEPKPQVNCDYSLFEYLHSEISNLFNEIKTPENKYLSKTYVSKTDKNEIKAPESKIDVSKRVNKLKNHIKNTHQNTNDVVLIVTHMSIVNEFLQKDSHEHFPMGQITQIQLF